MEVRLNAFVSRWHSSWGLVHAKVCSTLLTISFSRLDFLRNWRKGRSQETEASGTPVPPGSDATKGDAKKPASAKKKRVKEPEDTKPTLTSAAAVDPAADPKSKTKRRKKDGSPISAKEDKKQKRTAGANSMSPSSHAARGSPAMTGKMEGLLLPGSKPASAMLPGYQPSPSMGVGVGVNPLAPGMGQNTMNSPFVPPGSQPTGVNAAGSWFMPS